MKDIKETTDYCSKIFIQWFFDEKENPSMEYKDNDKEFLEESFITKILLKKFKVFDIKIHLPIHLLILLSLCTNENPGQSQVILKKLLLSIKERKGPIPDNYVIKHEDFGYCFTTSFPIIENKTIRDKYEKLWNKQKRKTNHPLESDNLCDTVEWWKEVMK